MTNNDLQNTAQKNKYQVRPRIPLNQGDPVDHAPLVAPVVFLLLQTPQRDKKNNKPTETTSFV